MKKLAVRYNIGPPSFPFISMRHFGGHSVVVNDSDIPSHSPPSHQEGLCTGSHSYTTTA